MMVDTSVVLNTVTSPFLLVYLGGLVFLFAPVVLLKRRAPYAFTKFFGSLNRRLTKEQVVTGAVVLALVILFGAMLSAVDGKQDSYRYVLRGELKEEESPVTLVVFDISMSMANPISSRRAPSSPQEATRYAVARSVFSELVKTANPAWKIGLVVFSDEVYLARVPVGFEDRSLLLTDSLEREIAKENAFGEISGGTKLHEAVVFAIDFLNREYPRAKERSLVVISDMDYPIAKLITISVETESTNTGFSVITVNAPSAVREETLKTYFGASRGRVVTVSNMDHTNQVSSIADEAFRAYPFAGTDESSREFGAQKQEGLPRLVQNLLLATAGASLFWVIWRGTLAKRIP